MRKSLQATSLLRVLFVVAISAVLFILPAHRAGAAELSVLHTFCLKLNCGDGQYPEGALVQDPLGNLYGVTIGGGAHNAGVIFGLFPQTGREHHYRYRALYDFCELANCVDGNGPNAPLIVGSDGSLYGTTMGGGAANGDGVVFRLSPVPGQKKWIYTILYNFCATRSSCADGSDPSGGLTYAGAQDGLLYDGRSPLYGFTYRGGRHFGGVAYSLRSRRHWSEHVLYGFCAQGGTDCTDGYSPYLTPLLDAAGNLYGVAGLPGYVFKLSPSEAPKWDEAVLYKLCSVSNCADGYNPSSLAIDRSGNLFGTARNGGSSTQCGTVSPGCGVLFEVTPDGTEAVLHDFCLDQSCNDGRYPDGIVLDQSDGIYGVTVGGGAGGHGTVFRFAGGSLATIYNFCAGRCRDGENPQGLIIDAAGNLFGNTTGTTYELAP